MIQVVGIENLSMVDYDEKLACTLFTRGCNFRCPFCQNSSLVLDPNIPSLNEDAILSDLKKKVGLLDAVCITGGEATLQENLIPFIKKVKDLGLLVKLDSNGYAPEVLRDVLKANLVDYVAMDVKGCRSNYATICGLPKMDLSKIEESISLLINSNIEFEFRTTLLNEYHSEECMEEIFEMINGCKKYAMQKYKDNPNCIEHGFTPVPYKKVLSYKLIAEKTIPNVIIRGY